MSASNTDYLAQIIPILPVKDVLEALEFYIKKLGFDLVFIDADKKNYQAYYENVLPKLIKNGHFIIDNIFLNGKLSVNSDDKLVTQLKTFYQKLKSDERIETTFLPFHDGMLWGRKKSIDCSSGMQEHI